MKIDKLIDNGLLSSKNGKEKEHEQSSPSSGYFSAKVLKPSSLPYPSLLELRVTRHWHHYPVSTVDTKHMLIWLRHYFQTGEQAPDDPCHYCRKS